MAFELSEPAIQRKAGHPEILCGEALVIVGHAQYFFNNCGFDISQGLFPKRHVETDRPLISLRGSHDGL